MFQLESDDIQISAALHKIQLFMPGNDISMILLNTHTYFR